MKVLVDTNILLDGILLREPHLELSKRVLQCCQSLVDGYIAVHTFSNMFYILHETEEFSVEDCRSTSHPLLPGLITSSPEILLILKNRQFPPLR